MGWWNGLVVVCSVQKTIQKNTFVFCYSSLFLGYLLDHASRQRTETELGEQKKTSLVYLA